VLPGNLHVLDCGNRNKRCPERGIFLPVEPVKKNPKGKDFFHANPFNVSSLYVGIWEGRESGIGILILLYRESGNVDTKKLAF
jgi:hypothetical protein